MSSLETWLEQQLVELQNQSLFRTPSVVDYEDAVHARVNGKPCVLFCSNDYLGLAATREPLDVVTGATASRLVSGTHDSHQSLERELAAWLDVPATLLFSSGYAANVGALSSLIQRSDYVFSDALNHASLIDGIRLARCRTTVYPHRDLTWLRHELERLRPAQGWIITESLFSMDGDIAPLEGLSQLAREFGLFLYVDDAHALGVLGHNGRGLTHHLNPRPDVTVGTLGKAFGVQGAFAVGSERLINWLFNTARAHVFSTAISPLLVAAARNALERVQQSDELREQLHSNTTFIRESLLADGWELRGSPESPIIPIVLGSAIRALAWSQRLFHQGVFVHPIRPPTVPKDTARLRIVASAQHSTEDCRKLLHALSNIRSSELAESIG